MLTDGAPLSFTTTASVKEYPVFRPGSPFFTGKSGFGIVGIGYGMARGGGKIGYEPGRFRGL